jgi:hypothetical protein
MKTSLNRTTAIVLLMFYASTNVWPVDSEDFPLKVIRNEKSWKHQRERDTRYRTGGTGTVPSRFGVNIRDFLKDRRYSHHGCLQFAAIKILCSEDVPHLGGEVVEGWGTVETQRLEDLTTLVKIHHSKEHLAGVELGIP